MPEEKNSLKFSAVKITVKGFVQGVGFRYFIARIAAQLELNGYAKNLFNGDVEIYAEGRKEFLVELIKKTRVGNSHSRVESINIEWLDFNNKYDNFDIL